MKSLQWLRGWVSPKAVEVEFLEMQRYNAHSNACASCQKTHAKCDHPPPNLREKFKELLRTRTMRPFCIIMGAYFISQFGGLSPIRPFMVQIFKAYSIPMDANWATVSILLRFKRNK